MEINLKNSRSIIIGSIYRPPSARVDQLHVNISNHVTNVMDSFSKSDFVITGDFNYDTLTPNLGKHINRLCTQLQLKNVICTPTRVTEKSKSCIDFIMVSNNSKVFATGNIPVGFSDHNLVYTAYKSCKIKAKPKMVKTRSYRKFNVDQFQADLTDTNWNVVFQATDPCAAWCYFKDIFTNISDKHAPLVEVRIKGNQPPWFNEEILSLCKDRDFYKGKAQKSGSTNDWETFRQIKNLTNNMIKQVKKSYYTNCVTENKHDGKQLWKIIKSILPSKTHHSVKEIVVDGITVTESVDIANHFNTFFSNIGLKLAQAFDSTKVDNSSDVSVDQDVVHHFEFTSINEDFVCKQLLNLGLGKATGIDGLSSRLLKAGAHQIAGPLTHIMNLSISTATIPPEWKTAIVTPIYKDGCRTDCSNYRPISVLPVLSKILERAVHAQLYNHLLENNLLTNTQSGFRPRHSTLTAATDVTDYILGNMDKGDLTGAVFLDLKKAFDTVDHGVLLSKLCNLGIKNNELNWFTNYLSNRQQCTVINNVYSDYMQISVGVPQGSILGPLLFICFINDLPNVIAQSKIVLYADDTAILYNAKTSSEVNTVLNEEISHVASWMYRNKLTVNASKTKVMMFGSQRKTKNCVLDVNLNNVKLEQVSAFKYLGLWFDPSLKWDTHIDKIASKISQRTGVLRRIRQYIDQKTMCMMYNAIILPHIDYCCPIWTSTSNKYVNKIQILQNHVARLTLGCKVRDKHVKELYQELRWMNVQQRSDYFKTTLMFRCTHGAAPDYLSESFVARKLPHSYRTRSQSSGKLYIERTKTDWGRRTFRNSAARLWNNLPTHVINARNIQSFKKNLKQLVLNPAV